MNTRIPVHRQRCVYFVSTIGFGAVVERIVITVPHLLFHCSLITVQVIGFLEACRDRMGDIIEAGAQGLLGESLMERCLRANDAIMRTLEAEKVLNV